MVDGISVDGGFSDDELDFSNVLKGDTIRDVLMNFGQKMIDDVRQSIDRKGLNSSGGLSQSLDFQIKAKDKTLTYTFEMADYGSYLDEGVNGRSANVGSRFSFKFLTPSREEVASLSKWVRQKGFGRFGIKTEKQAEGLAFGIAKENRKFGMEATNFFQDIAKDGRVAELENELAKRFGDTIISLF